VLVEVQRVYDTDLDVLVATFDVKNAFQNILRSCVENRLLQAGAAASHLHAFFLFMYGSATQVYIRSGGTYEAFTSSTGLRQGDMTSSLLFAATFTDVVLRAFHSAFPGRNPANTLWAYLDDITVALSAPDLLLFKTALNAVLPSVGLALNMRKCRVLGDRGSPQCREALRAEGFQIDQGCTRVLGLPVGDSTACLQWALTKVRGYASFWSRLRSPLLHPSVALLLTRICGQPKFLHIAKALPPHVCLPAATEFDVQVLSTVAEILHADLSDEASTRSILHIPPQAILAPACYAHTVAAMSAPTSTLAQFVSEALVASTSMASSSPFVGHAVLSAIGFGANTILETSMCATAPVDFVVGLKIRLGLPVCRMLPERCSCGFLLRGVHPLLVHSHLLSCVHNTGINKTTRHHMVVRALQDTCHEFHLCTVREPKFLHPTLRPDLIITGTEATLIDVSIVDPLHAPPGRALDKRVQDKMDKYDVLNGPRTLFFSFCLEVFGTMHHTTLSFLHHVARDLPPSMRSTFIRRALQAAQRALLLGNARVVLHAEARLQGREWALADAHVPDSRRE
jgi:hypothetical protein